MSAVIVIEIILFGKGGHGSRPDLCIDPISSAVDFHIKHRELNKKYTEIVCTFPYFHGGEMDSVFPSQCKLKGSLRSMSNKLTDLYEKDLINLLEELKQ